jgi:hypothetical protein
MTLAILDAPKGFDEELDGYAVSAIAEVIQCSQNSVGWVTKKL